jgi:hypothetical protein
MDSPVTLLNLLLCDVPYCCAAWAPSPADAPLGVLPGLAMLPLLLPTRRNLSNTLPLPLPPLIGDASGAAVELLPLRPNGLLAVAVDMRGLLEAPAAAAAAAATAAAVWLLL